MVRWVVVTGESIESHGPANLVYSVVIMKKHCLKQAGGRLTVNNNLGLYSEIHMYFMVGMQSNSYTHTHMHM